MSNRIKLTIAVVEDERGWRDHLCTHLESDAPPDFEIEAVGFATTQSFRQAVAQEGFAADVIILDIDFESVGEDKEAGFDLLEALPAAFAENASNSTPPPLPPQIYLMSGRQRPGAESEWREAAQRAAAVDYIPKTTEMLEGALLQRILARFRLFYSDEAPST